MERHYVVKLTALDMVTACGRLQVGIAQADSWQADRKENELVSGPGLLASKVSWRSEKSYSTLESGLHVFRPLSLLSLV